MSIDDLQAQLRGALDQQFATLKQHYEQAVADARKQGAAEAERQSAARLEAARAEWEAQVEARLAAARTEAQQQAMEHARAQQRALEHQLERQLEQTVQHAVNSVKRSTELELEGLRKRLDEEVKAEQQRGETALQEERRRAEQALATAQDEVRRANQAVAEEQTRAAAELDAIKQLLEAEIESARGQVAAAREEAAAVRQQIAAATQDAEAARAELATAQAQAADARAAATQDAEAARAELATAQAEAADARAAAAAANEAVARANDAAANAAAAAAKAVAPIAPAVPSAVAHVPEAVRAIDRASSLSQTLEALLQHGGAIAGRAALFLINGDRLKPWKTNGIPEIDVQTVESSITGRDLLARAIQSGQATPASPALPAPPFARLTGDQAVAVPLMIGGRAVAVFYADTGGGDGAAGWADAADLVVRYASTVAALRAALRTFDVLRGGSPEPAAAAGGEDSARRYARLLVSEIKLYNEGAVRVGRQQRDLRKRLREEIDRALRLYEERVPAAVGGRDQLFQQELVQTLADGDPSLLGN